MDRRDFILATGVAALAAPEIALAKATVIVEELPKVAVLGTIL